MPKLHLTDAVVRDLPAPTTRTDYFDDVVTGLSLRVTPAGHKSWAFVYKRAGRTHRVTLDGYPAMELAGARKAARARRIAVASGAHPAADRRAERLALTFGDLAQRYVERYARPHKKSWRQDARQLRVFALPRWKARPAAEITRGDVRDLLADVATTRSGVIANRLRACLSKVFAWAVAEGLLQTHPAAGLPPAAKETSRERVLTDDELGRVWAEIAAAEARWRATPPRTPYPADALSPTVGLWLRLRVLTGQRGGEVAALRWRDVDLERAIWEVPGSRYKSGRPHVVPLSPWVLALLRARRDAHPDDDYVLEGGRGRAARSGVGPAFSVPDFEPHDLRRTMATRLAQLGVSRFIIARVLGHSDASVTGIYDRFEYLADKRDALDRWAVYVARLVGEDMYADRGRVLEFPQAAGRR